MENIEFKEITAENFNVHSLDLFKRYQEVKRCWRRLNGTYALTNVVYTEDWNLNELQETANKIIKKLKEGAYAYGAFSGTDVIGFALLDGKLFGSKKQYVDLAEFYVSLPFRNKGIGKKLFCSVCEKAKILGAKKLYISAHSAEDTIAAYTSYGCIYAEEINTELAEKEPCDLQLEYDLRIQRVEDKKKYMPLLLIADEQESMIEKYLTDGTMFVLDDDGVKGEITVLKADKETLEIKSLAVYPEYRKMGYGKELIEYVARCYTPEYTQLSVGTGDSPLTVPFYEKCGFVKSHTVKNFFSDNYDHPIIEGGVQLKDMIYLIRKLT